MSEHSPSRSGISERPSRLTFALRQFDSNRIASLEFLFSDEVESDPWVLFHGTSGFNSEAIETQGFSSLHQPVSAEDTLPRHNEPSRIRRTSSWRLLGWRDAAFTRSFLRQRFLQSRVLLHGAIRRANPVSDDTGRHAGERAQQQGNHVALVGRHLLPDDQPQHDREAH